MPRGLQGGQGCGLRFEPELMAPGVHPPSRCAWRSCRPKPSQTDPTRGRSRVPPGTGAQGLRPSPVEARAHAGACRGAQRMTIQRMRVRGDRPRPHHRDGRRPHRPRPRARADWALSLGCLARGIPSASTFFEQVGCSTNMRYGLLGLAAPGADRDLSASSTTRGAPLPRSGGLAVP